MHRVSLRFTQRKVALRLLVAVLLGTAIWSTLIMTDQLTGAWDQLNGYVNPQEARDDVTAPAVRAQLVSAVVAALAVVVQAVAGLALLFNLFYTRQTLSVSQEGQITDRYLRTIDQLGTLGDGGKRVLENRLGAIYELERLMRDSDKDQKRILEVLTTYV
jgi:hypothetical protein